MSSGVLFLTRCTGGSCPNKNDCYRFRMMPRLTGSGRVYPTPPVQPNGKCFGFLPILKGDQVRPIRENT